MNRREFLKFLGASSITIVNAQALTSLVGCSSVPKRDYPLDPPFVPLQPTFEDRLVLADGFQWDYLIGWRDALNKDHFGYNNDFTYFIPLYNSKSEGLLWVNHESVTSVLVSGWIRNIERTKKQVDIERYNVGGSIVHIRKNKDGKWEYLPNSAFNRRINAFTEIPFSSKTKILGQKTAMGTLANCAGGFTPWGHILTCEENFQNHVGDNPRNKWGHFFPYPEEHYGWVVEVNPMNGRCKKLIPLGRFAHECAYVVQAADGRCVVYSGDDRTDGHLYKFIADKKGSLESGTLYVAKMDTGEWIPLTLENSLLKDKFKDQTDLLIQTREASALVKATPLDRPEDIEQNPGTKSMLIACTHNEEESRYHGYILSIDEDNQDPLSLTFKSSKFIEAGDQAGFSSPDNFTLDKKGNLWMTVDISEDEINTSPYRNFGNNGLYYIPLSGPHAGVAFQVASAPTEAEFTGPSFSPDGRTLFLSVQHPGSQTTDAKKPTSRWPHFGVCPRPAVVAISGPVLDQLVNS